jgi:hypothetical protein
MNQPVHRDERTLSVEDHGYRLAYFAVTYGLLLSTAYRAFVRSEPAWDLLALVVMSGVITTLYQASQRVLTVRWAIASLTAVIVALLLGALFAWTIQ